MQLTRKNRIRFMAMALFAMLAMSFSQCHAQFNSSVEGTITDQTGAFMPNAQVTLHSMQTNVDLTTTTRSAGYFRFNAIGPGDYQVTVEVNGFAKKTTDTHVGQDEVAAVNMALAVSGTSAVVNVTSVADSLNTDETRLQTTLESEQIENLPLQNGNVLETVRLAPGVTGIDEDRNLWAVNINGSDMNAQANGRSASSNTYQLDGVSIQFNTFGAGVSNFPISFVPSEDMIQEVALEVNSYAVDYGASSSMKVNFTTKGGTDKFHGTISDRYSGRGLNAIADFASPELPASRRWYSGSVGGPIWKDKTFFFVSYLHQNQATALAGLQHWATNEFTGTWAPANYPYNPSAPVGHSQGANVKNLLVPFPVGNASKGQVGTLIKQGVTAHASDLFATGTPGVCAVPIKDAPFFLGKQIGSNTIDCGMEIVDQGVFNQAPRVNGFQIDGRLDQNFRGGKDHAYAAYVLEPQVSDFLWWRPGFNSTTPSGARYLNAQYTHTFTPNILSQTSLSYMRIYSSFASSPANVIPFLTLLLNGGDDATDYFGTPGSPSNTKMHNYQLRQDVIWAHARHNIKAGFSAKHLDQYVNAAGSYSKAEVPIYFGWSDLLDDHPWQYTLDTLSGTTGQFLPNIQGAAVTQFGIYGQDDWKVKPNLLITLGLRWDDYGNPAPYGANTLPYLNLNSPSGSSLRENIITDNISTQKVSNAFAHRQNSNFLPRVGFAWSPMRNHKLSIHGGFGFYEDAMNLGGSISGLSINSPSYLNTVFCATCVAPLNVMDPRNYYGTDWRAQAPYGNTYSFPTLTPVGHDSHGEIILNEGGTPTVLTSSLSGVDPKLKPQKTSLYNVQVEKEILDNLIVGVGYSGSFSWGQYANGDYNSFPGDQIKNNGTALRLSPEWAGISFNTNLLRSNYNALLLTIRQNYHRLSWQASYTFGKTLAYGGVINDIYDASHYYGPASGSVPASFNGTVAYELPGRNLNNFFERAALGGWEISAIATAQSGSPFSLTTSGSFVPISSAPVSEGGTCSSSCTNVWNPSAAGTYLGNGVSGNLVNVPQGIKRKGFSRAQWKSGVFSSLGYTSNSIPTYSDKSYTSEFTNPQQYGVSPVYSNQGYNTFVGPGYLGLDGAVHKKVLLPWFGKETSTLTLGLEGSNIMNRVNLGGPASTDLNSVSSFGLGVSQSANQARILQVIGKFQF